MIDIYILAALYFLQKGISEITDGKFGAGITAIIMAVGLGIFTFYWMLGAFRTVPVANMGY